MENSAISAVSALQALKAQLEARLRQTEDYRALVAINRAIAEVRSSVPAMPQVSAFPTLDAIGSNSMLRQLIAAHSGNATADKAPDKD